MILKNPPPRPSVVKQPSLAFEKFTSFLVNHSNSVESVSNAMAMWDAVPKYFFTPAQIKKLRGPDGLAKPHTWQFMHKGELHSVTVQPALIQQPDGGFKAFFPSMTEELVEEALIKIFSDQNHGSYDPIKNESWVKFTLRMIYKELKTRGKQRNLSQIKHAINVMSLCVLTVTVKEKEAWRGPILQDLVTVGRDDYQDEPDAKHVARLPVFVGESIKRLEYRQYNYENLMKCQEQLSRWIYKKLIHNFTQASVMNDYHFSYASIVNDSGLLQQSDAQLVPNLQPIH